MVRLALLAEGTGGKGMDCAQACIPITNTVRLRKVIFMITPVVESLFTNLKFASCLSVGDAENYWGLPILQTNIWMG
ncbi:hypothetical protein D3C87_1605160 [compost metagenome]